jgi:hypothetical protein
MSVITGVQGYTSLTQQTRLCLESNQPTPGEQLLMPQTAGASTMSLTTQPNTLSPTTGMHLHFYVIGNGAAGTIVISGTKADGVTAQSSITYHINAAPQNAQGYSEFTTREVWGTVNASGITLSGLTPCQVIVFGSAAGKYLIPITADPEEKITHHAPQDKRGILFKNLRVVQLTKAVDLAKFDSDLYPDSLWAYYMAVGPSPTVTTVPATPTTLLVSTAIAASMTLTSAPAAPGEFLIFSITGNTTSGTIVVGGSDVYGNAYGSNETITFTSAATQTVYSSRRYSVVNNGGANKFATTGGTGASIAVSGMYAWTYAWTFDGINNLTPYSAALEVFDGVMGVKLPGAVLSDVTFDWQKEKEILLQAKGSAQDYLVVGDPNPTTTVSYLSGANPFATIAQPTSQPVVSWPASFYIDMGSGTPFTTQDGSMLTYKLAITTGRKWNYAGDGMQRPSYVTWDAEPDYALDATIIFQNYANYIAYFKQNTPLILSSTFTGNLLGSISSTTYFEQVQITLPAKIDTFKVDQTKNPVEGALKLMSCYDFSNLGYAYRIAVTAQQPPTYLS